MSEKLNRAIINGQEYELIPIRKKEKTGWEYEEPCVALNSHLNCLSDTSKEDKKLLYDIGNYFSDMKIAANMGAFLSLMLRIHRWQALNDDPIDTKNRFGEYWGFRYLPYVDDFDICQEPRCEFGKVYFTSREKAEECLAIFREQLQEYFDHFTYRTDYPMDKISQHCHNGVFIVENTPENRAKIEAPRLTQEFLDECLEVHRRLQKTKKKDDLL